MARFNQKKVSPLKTVNYHNAPAYKKGDDMELFSIAATHTGENTYYESRDKREARMYELLQVVDPELIANIAFYCREKLNLRSVPLILIQSLIQQRKAKREWIERVIQRADEITELFALHKNRSGRLKPVPNSLRRGTADALSKFNDYQYRKYARQGRGDISFWDVLNLIRPKPNNDQERELFGQILKGTLPPIETWETQISAAGDDPVKKREAWERLVDKDQIPYMALLRNLRNLLDNNISQDRMDKVLSIIADPERVRKGKQIPFRYFSAYRAIEEENYPLQGKNIKPVYRALETAIRSSLQHISGFDFLKDKRVIVAADTSGSMFSPVISGSSKKESSGTRNGKVKSKFILPMHVACLMGRMLANTLDLSVYGIFGEHWIPMTPSDNIIESTFNDLAQEGKAGYATLGHKVLDWANKIDERLGFDAVIFFSDNQIYDMCSAGSFLSFRGLPGNASSEFERSWKQFKKRNPNAKAYFFDLVGYSTLPLNPMRPDVFLISGWSDSIFQVLSDYERGEDFMDKLRKGVR